MTLAQIRDAILNNPLLVLAVVMAAINTATDHTFKGYAYAVLVALARFLTDGPLTAHTKNQQLKSPTSASGAPPSTP